mmetsp:Transcript_22188/g.61574  ORF Transcript_22188/g.61574 Transcript_22188/m.61574 type:complete len:437 (-) Transcript_22188:368-1678(-)
MEQSPVGRGSMGKAPLAAGAVGIAAIHRREGGRTTQQGVGKLVVRGEHEVSEVAPPLQRQVVPDVAAAKLLLQGLFVQPFGKGLQRLQTAALALKGSLRQAPARIADGGRFRGGGAHQAWGLPPGLEGVPHQLPQHQPDLPGLLITHGKGAPQASQGLVPPARPPSREGPPQPGELLGLHGEQAQRLQQLRRRGARDGDLVLCTLFRQDLCLGEQVQSMHDVIPLASVLRQADFQCHGSQAICLHVDGGAVKGVGVRNKAIAPQQLRVADGPVCVEDLLPLLDGLCGDHLKHMGISIIVEPHALLPRVGVVEHVPEGHHGLHPLPAEAEAEPCHQGGSIAMRLLACLRCAKSQTAVLLQKRHRHVLPVLVCHVGQLLGVVLRGEQVLQQGGALQQGQLVLAPKDGTVQLLGRRQGGEVAGPLRPGPEGLLCHHCQH